MVLSRYPFGETLVYIVQGLVLNLGLGDTCTIFDGRGTKALEVKQDRGSHPGVDRSKNESRLQSVSSSAISWNGQEYREIGPGQSLVDLRFRLGW